MLNNRNIIKLGTNSQTVNFNSPCTGILQRSHSKSRFIKCHINSPIADRIFTIDGSEPFINLKPHEHFDREKLPTKITVLQSMLFGDNNAMIEYVFNSDLIEEIKE